MNTLSQILPTARILTSPLQRIAYANDASYFRLVPQAVVQPNSVDEIQGLFRYSQAQHIPMTFRAAGTSLSGQAVTDGILVDLSKYWGHIQVEQDGALIRTQPGVVGAYANAILKRYGRRIGPDPASMDACMMGGILANNSSGMCCGVIENAYRTLHSMTFVLPNGLVIDTGAADAPARLHEGAPEVESGLLELKSRLLADADLTERVRRRYQMKNNNGYLLNAFVDFETPLDILTHLLIGSEGTLGFIAEAVLHTLPDFHLRYTGQLYFKNIQDAASAIAPLRDSGARAAEIMDRAALRSVGSLPGAPALLSQLPESAAAILVEYQSSSGEELKSFRKAAERTCKEIHLLHIGDPLSGSGQDFTDDPTAQAALWKLRKGIIPSVGAVRPSGTTLLCEDVVFPIARLAEAVTDLQGLFAEHNYPEGVIFGHAKDGNLHFLIAQSFNTDEDVLHFDHFMRDMVATVSGKYDGALKAEHGTGRNMSPFVATEWGETAYEIMQDLKSLLDPSGMLNPGVVINPDPQAHRKHVKSMSPVAAEVDQCIECGFCEVRCPSRRLTLTPRQRIVAQREISRLRLAGTDGTTLASLLEEYPYGGVETCAVDGLCATACPVNINTGELTKSLRQATITPGKERAAEWLAEHFKSTEAAVGFGVRLGHLAERVIGAKGVSSLTKTTGKITGMRLPQWNAYIPFPSRIRDTEQAALPREYIYFPSCISRQLGAPRKLSQLNLSLADSLMVISTRAGVGLQIPSNITGTCCGMPFSSKGYRAAYRATLHRAITKFWEWSGHGELPIVIDTTSCVYTLRTCADGLLDEDQILYRQLKLLDSIEFLHDILLPKLEIHPVEEDVILHPNCSARKLGVQDKLAAIAQRCARSAVVPLDLDCCAFAGDRGLLYPELTRSATSKEAAEVNAREYGGYYSSNITCEIGLSEATGKDYQSIVYLVERATR
jgi:D-lactate dehydrogenase